MGWPLAAELPPDSSDQSVTVALIAALGTVVVALVGLGAQWLSRSARTPEATVDPHLGERQAVTETLVKEDRRTLAMLDRHVDRQGDAIERLRWEMDDMKAWRDEHVRRHGAP